MRRPSPGELFSEMAGLARAYGWSLDSVLDLEHRDRRRLLALIPALDAEEGVPA
ncbi:MAG TPA: hypothetical protein VHF89_13975 [Solirubrobacteraceae bacterium]|nr:hypothetical protein [Solirubrobacteraceae bacterium]